MYLCLFVLSAVLNFLNLVSSHNSVEEKHQQKNLFLNRLISNPNWRQKRYLLEGSRWNKTMITYRISNYSNKLKKAECDDDIRKAFDLWSSVTPLKFIQKTNDPVDIKIKFVTGNHNDGRPFDNSGNSIAHAYYPQYGGEIHFNNDIKWTVNSYDGVNLLRAAAHEIGHCLGLKHSQTMNAIMAPVFRGYYPELRLRPDDIQGIQSLYGIKEIQVTKSASLSSKRYEKATRPEVQRTESPAYFIIK